MKFDVYHHSLSSPPPPPLSLSLSLPPSLPPSSQWMAPTFKMITFSLPTSVVRPTWVAGPFASTLTAPSFATCHNTSITITTTVTTTTPARDAQTLQKCSTSTSAAAPTLTALYQCAARPDNSNSCTHQQQLPRMALLLPSFSLWVTTTLPLLWKQKWIQPADLITQSR